MKEIEYQARKVPYGGEGPWRLVYRKGTRWFVVRDAQGHPLQFASEEAALDHRDRRLVA